MFQVAVGIRVFVLINVGWGVCTREVCVGIKPDCSSAVLVSGKLVNSPGKRMGVKDGSRVSFKFGSDKARVFVWVSVAGNKPT
jgi:hypothetical protein